MKFNMAQKKQIYEKIDDACYNMFEVTCMKGRATEVSKFLVAFLDASDAKCAEDALVVVQEYIDWCATDFRKWKEASPKNWIGYIRSSDRFKIFLSKSKLGHFKEIAGKEGESSWTF